MKKLLMILFASMFLFAQHLSSQSLNLVKDVNTHPVELDLLNNVSSVLMPSQSILYFDATDNRGETLWRTDGTTEGSYSLSAPPVFSTYWIPFGDHSILYCSNEYYSDKGNELWISDGTADGTFLLKDINAGNDNSYPSSFINVDGTIFFKASTSEYGSELYKTDGTKQGTKLVKDIEPGPSSSYPLYEFDSPGLDAGALNGKLIFSAYTSQTGRELFISDGTEAGTTLLKDLSEPDGFSNPKSFVNLNDELYFLAKSDSTFLWKTDGTASGTVKVAYLNAEELVVSDGTIFCVGYDSQHGDELWISDGTTSGTHLLMDINPGVSSSISGEKKIYPVGTGGKVCFSANDGVHGTEPWISDGTIAGTQLLKDIDEGSSGFVCVGFTTLGEKVIFSRKDNLWSTDGTTEGTKKIGFNFPEDGLWSLVEFNNKVYVINKTALYSSDGTSAGTQMLEINLNETEPAENIKIIKLNDTQYLFSATDSADTHANLYVTDGTSEGTTLLYQHVPDQFSIFSFAASINGKVFFSLIKGSENELWISDGTIAGTEKITGTLFPQFIQKTDFAVLNDILYFRNYNNNEYKLWRSDGTAAGTYQVKEISTGNDNVNYLAVYNGALFFQAQDDSKGIELYKSDGTENGTVLLSNINPGSSSSEPSDFHEFKGKLYFTAESAGTGRELYVTDGTGAGTHLFIDIDPGAAESDPINFAVVGDELFFSASPGENHGQLWKTDGTIAGTVLVTDLIESNKTWALANKTASGGLLYFTMNGDVFESDGTADGTFKLKKSPDATHLSDVNGDLYFRVSTYAVGDNLWRTNGTECGTQQLDLSPEIDDIADIVLVDGNTIFLSLNSLNYGIELFRYQTVPISSVEICNGFDDDCDGLIDEDAPVVSISTDGPAVLCEGDPITLVASGADVISWQWYKNGALVPGETNSTYTAFYGTDYYVTVNENTACPSVSNTISIERLPRPNAEITVLNNGNLDLCLGAVNLKANSGNDLSWQWLLNGEKIDGASNKNYQPLVPGNYRVKVMKSNGCASSSKKVVVISSCKNDFNNSNESIVSIYPNPFSSSARLDLSALKVTAGFVEVLISDLSGRILFRRNYSYQGEIEIGNELPAGFYLIEVIGENGRSIIPVVKE